MPLNPTLPPPALGDRALFPSLAAAVYLNHAGISPPSALVTAAVTEALAVWAEQGSGAFPRFMLQRDRLKERLAGLIGATARDLALRPNTTQGVIDVAVSLPWRAGERVLTFAGEFPANVTPWQQAAAAHSLRLERLPLDGFGDGSGDGLGRVEDALRKGGVRLIAVSAVQFRSGLRMPLHELSALARRYDAELFVDAIQAAGVVPLDGLAERVDYLTCGSHKWLMGTDGNAFLYIAPSRVRALRPLLAGWLSHEQATSFLFEGPDALRYDRPVRAQADFLEGGAQDSLGFVALEAGIQPLLELGIPTIYAHIQAYHDALEPGLQALGFTSLRAVEPDARSGILSVLPPPGLTAAALSAALGARGVICATPDGALRFAPHWPNAVAEATAVLGAVEEAVGVLR
ncbi:aminotransferase class V-fold PLP-dependent enzyme [Myxococcota bacterium]|nr:aminotransferase class V-fold PLP-dependent enzyme [Myxococcota bacterium]